MDIWRHQELHPQLTKLLGMWDGIFPKQLLDRIHQAVKQSSPAQMSGRQNIPPMRYPAQAQPVQQHSGQWRPTSGAPPLQAVAPYATHATSNRGPYTAVQQPVYTARESTPPASAQYVAPPNGYNYAHPGTQGPPQWQHQQSLMQQSVYPPAQVQQSSQPMVLPSLLTSLLSSGLLSVQQPVSFAPVATSSTAPVVSYTHPASRAGTPEPINPEDCKFVPSRLKVSSWLPSLVMHVCLYLWYMSAFTCGTCLHFCACCRVASASWHVHVAFECVTDRDPCCMLAFNIYHGISLLLEFGICFCLHPLC